MKTCFVIGLGRFGSAAAERLYDMGYEVIVMDQSEERVRLAADKATYSAVGDAREPLALKAAGAEDCDVAIVAIGSDLAASVVITMNLRDLGVPQIICKAQDEMYKRALERIGADRVLIPEREMAQRLVQSLGAGSLLEYMEFSEDYGIAEVTPPKTWVGKTLGALELRKHYQIQVLALKNEKTDELRMSPGAEDRIAAEDTVVLMGKNEDLAMLRGQ